MQVSVVGTKDRTFNRLLKMAVRSFGKNLFSTRLYKNISVHVAIYDRIGAGGYCECLDFGGKARNFLIELNRYNKKIHMVKILAHEMVHVKQYAMNQLRDKPFKSKTVTSWYGVEFGEDVSYWDHPWEIEAYGLENSLVAKFLAEHNAFKELKTKQSDWFMEDDKN